MKKLYNVILEVEIIVAGDDAKEGKENAEKVLTAILKKGTGNWFNVSNARVIYEREGGE